MKGSYWFNRFKKDVKKISPDIVIREIRNGFYRIYYKNAYIGECWGNMPEMGYDIFERSQGFENYEYYQDYHSNADTALRVKNFVEGYWESLEKIRIRLYQFKNDKEFYERAINGYKTMRIK